jgi:hypothetical protein
MLRSRANTLPRRRCPPSSGRHCAPSRGRFPQTEEGTPQGGVNTSLRLIAVQDGRCPICKDTLFAVDHRPQSPLEWEQWLATTRKTKLLCQALVFERGGGGAGARGRWCCLLEVVWAGGRDPRCGFACTSTAGIEGGGSDGNEAPMSSPRVRTWRAAAMPSRSLVWWGRCSLTASRPRAWCRSRGFRGRGRAACGGG